MLDHVSIGVRDLKVAGSFYDGTLGALGYRRTYGDDQTIGFGADETLLWLIATTRPVPADDASGLHFCFAAPSREAVDGFHRAALANGGAENGAPGLREDYGPGYYAAFDLTRPVVVRGGRDCRAPQATATAAWRRQKALN